MLSLLLQLNAGALLGETSGATIAGVVWMLQQSDALWQELAANAREDEPERQILNTLFMFVYHLNLCAVAGAAIGACAGHYAEIQGRRFGIFQAPHQHAQHQPAPAPINRARCAG